MNKALLQFLDECSHLRCLSRTIFSSPTWHLILTMPISKKTALITGCSDGGIGASMAKVLHEKGYYVFATLRNISKAGTLTEIDDVEILELDVTLKESIARCAEEVRKRTGAPSISLLTMPGAIS